MGTFASFARPDLDTPEPPTTGWAVAASYPSSFTRPTFNQSEADYARRAGLNIYSREGQRFRNAILHSARRPEAVTIPQRQILFSLHTEGSDGQPAHDSRGRVVREMAALRREPFGQHNGYQDFVGAFLARVAYQIPVVTAVRYQGQLPMRLQPRLDKPNPWHDLTRGRP